MNGFTFNNHEEVALFLKVNSDVVKDSFKDRQKIETIETFLKFSNNIKGGCPCNKSARDQAAKTAYEKFVMGFLVNESEFINFMKQELGGLTSIGFRYKAEDISSFFII